MKVIVLTQPDNLYLMKLITYTICDKLQYQIVDFIYNEYGAKDILNNYFKYDLIICDSYYLNLQKGYNIHDIYWLITQAIIKKYENSQDPEIIKILKYLETHEISIFNQYITENTLDRVFFDDILPYIIFENKKMYFPKDHNFISFKNNKYVHNLLVEQIFTSPHLYITNTHKVNKNDIIIDAGTCEGNFALRYIDLCSKMYLIESDDKWIKPLQQTFKNYKDKVKIIHEYISDDKFIIDNLNLNNKNIFLKMDIEGSEPVALRGAKNTFNNNRLKASICAYHKQDDLIKIKSILQQYNYNISTSKGYMFFMNDLNIYNSLDFRRGVVYAWNY